MAKETNVLTDEFLAELYNAAIEDDKMCSSVCKYMEDEMLPDKYYQMLNNAIKGYFKKYRTAPHYNMLKQILSESRAVSDLLNEIKDLASGASVEGIMEQFEKYLKIVKFKNVYKEIKNKFENGDKMEAISMFETEGVNLKQFSLMREQNVDVAATLVDRYLKNKQRRTEVDSSKLLVGNFYIDGIDVVNRGRNLRSQLAVCIAKSGVGKSHFARHIGVNAAYVGGLNVLHIQLEGSSNEVMDAYSASILKVDSFDYEMGNLNSHIFEMFERQLQEMKGTLEVRSFAKFSTHPTTIDVYNAIMEFKDRHKNYPDIVIIDSLDLLGDSSGKKYAPKETRFQIINSARDLKDMANEFDCFVFATFQATVEDTQWVNNEKNVLTSYNTAECKGLDRPTSWFMSLNQSENEYEENTMRIHISKVRFGKKNVTIKICTDFAHECFYDRVRTLNLPSKA